MKRLLFFITIISLFSCASDPEVVIEGPEQAGDTIQKNNRLDSLEEQIKSDYDMSTVDDENSEEFMESLVEIEKKYGEQWDFCTCVIKNDSINKAFSSPVSDNEFERLSARFDVIDEKCKAFLVQNPNVTPEERAKHEKKVRNCLKEAGIR